MKLDSLSLVIDSKAAQADLAKLSLSLDKAGQSILKLDQTFARSAVSIDASINKSILAFQKYAQVIALLDKIKVVANPSQGILAIGNALAAVKGPSPATLRNIQTFMNTLATIKPMPGAAQFAKDLDMIAGAAGRAGAALATLPRQMQTYGSAHNAATRAVQNHASSVNSLGLGLGALTGRFNLAYQAGTLFSTVFSVFTLGEWVRHVYDAGIQMLKLQKAVLFATGSFEDGQKAMEEYLGIEQRLGLSISENIEYYGRFLIASRASNMSVKEANEVYSDVETALTVVGASTVQASLALYGLTEMMQKGVVYSKEFNRQIGAQIPGNAVLGARALSILKGEFVSVGDFFREMHKGTLLSADFIPVWANELKKMYGPLLELARARPDSIIQRLKNAFFEFNRAVGNGGFMAAIGASVTALTERIVTVGEDNIPHLTASAQHLADTLGANLGSAVQSAGSAMTWLMDHIDGVIKTVKFLVSFELAKMFITWSIGVAQTARAVWDLVFAMKALSASTLTGLAVTVGSAAMAAAYMSRSNATGETTSRGSSVTNGNVQDAIFSQAVDGLQGMLKELSNSFSMLGDSIQLLTGSGINGAKVMAFMGAAVGDVFNTIKGAIMLFVNPLLMIASIVTEWATTMGKVVYDIISGDFGSVRKDIAAGNTAMTTSRKKGEAAQAGYGRDVLVGTFDRDYNDVMAKAKANADQGAADHSKDIANRDIEAAIQQMKAAQANQSAAALFSDAVDQFKEGVQPIDFQKDIVEPIRALISGDYAKQNTPHRMASVVAKDGEMTMAQLRATGADNANIAPGTARDMLAFAKSYIGLNEHDNKSDLMGMFRGAGIQLDPEKAAWCAAFLNAVLAQKGVVGTKSAAASSFENWGEAVKKPMPGDVVVMKNHVGFYDGTNANGTIKVIGGNQGNKVSEANFKASDVLSYRRPDKRGVSAPYADAYYEGSSLENPLPGEPPSTPADKLAQMMMRDYKQVEMASAQGGPVARAASRIQEVDASIVQVIKRDQARVKSGLPTLFNEDILKGLVRAHQEEVSNMKDVADPIGKMIRMDQEANAVTKLRIAGLSDEADYLEQMNKATEEHYNAAERAAMADEKTLANQHLLNDQLAAQVDLLKARNSAQSAGITRFSADPIKNYVEDQLARYADQKNIPLDAARAKASVSVDGSTPLIKTWTDAAKEVTKSTALDAMAKVNGSNTGAVETIGMNPQMREQYNFARQVMGQIVPDKGQSIDKMFEDVAKYSKDTGEDFTGMVDSARKVHDQLQNVDGFRRWADSVEPFARKMQEIKGDFLEGLSDGLSNLMIGDKFDVQGFVHNIMKEVAKSSTDNLLAGAVNALGVPGLGPAPDGSMVRPFYVLNANDPTGMLGASTGSGGGGGGLLQQLLGGGSSSGLGGLGGTSFLGDIVHSLFGGGSGEAYGGGDFIGTSADSGGLFSSMGDWISSFFAGGGYTGPGGRNKPAGVVHAGEYVFDQASVNRIGLGNLSRLHKGYADGGYVYGPDGTSAPGSFGGGGGGNVEVNVIDQRGSGAPVQTRTRNVGDKKIIDVLVLDSMQRHINSGILDTSMGKNYGVSRQGNPR